MTIASQGALNFAINGFRLTPNKNFHDSMVGAAIVEFAIIFPLFLAVLYTTVQVCLILVDKTSIDYETENLLFETLTANDDTLYDPMLLQNKWEEKLGAARVKSTNPKITSTFCLIKKTMVEGLKDFDPPLVGAKLPPPEAIDLLRLVFTIDVPINCSLNSFSFGLTNDICRHQKKFFRIINSETIIPESEWKDENYQDCLIN